jgi:Glycosyl hydrolase family 12/Malectin domain
MLAIAFAVCVAFLGTSTPAAAQSTCAPQGTISINGNEYIYQQNEWNSTLEQCATVSGVGFTLTTADFDDTGGAPATYPSVFRGCHWGNCTSSNPFPIKESDIGSASTSVTITQPSGYNNDSAYDIWFNQTSTTSGQPNGTEIMIWINHQGSARPFGSQTATETIDGATWQVWTGNQTSWKIVSYVAENPVTSVSNLNLLPFFSDAVSRGSLESSWWLIDVEYGFEVWIGGKGLAASNFSVSASAATSCASICIDSGSTAAVSPFVADEDFVGGATIDHANTINTSKVTNPAPAAVYQSARVTTTPGAGTTFSYTIPGFTAGAMHTVRLHFCETYWTAAGKRKFNVSINGTQVLTDFDIFATAGGQNIANIQQFTEAADSSGSYVLMFTSDVDKALISGIEID